VSDAVGCSRESNYGKKCGRIVEAVAELMNSIIIYTLLQILDRSDEGK
jgi:hypothetical protein